MKHQIGTCNCGDWHGLTELKLVNAFQAVDLTEIHPHELGEDCGESECQICCQHDERDHGICLYCAHEKDPGEAIDRAMDYEEER
jgi:hypothetical protein